jgi:hypothetical protein
MRGGPIALVLALLVCASCGELKSQMAITSVSQCMSKNCTDHESTAYQQCEAVCRRTYGK